MVTLHLGQDAFLIDYQPTCVTLEAIVACVRGLGYQVEQMNVSQKVVSNQNYLTLPEPISSAVLLARDNKQFVFVDFYASWCDPCRIMEHQVLSTAEVKKALERFREVKVDTDRFPAAAQKFGVVGLPTLVVLDSEGVEVYRHLGPIQTEELVDVLNGLQQ